MGKRTSKPPSPSDRKPNPSLGAATAGAAVLLVAVFAALRSTPDSNAQDQRQYNELSPSSPPTARRTSFEEHPAVVDQVVRSAGLAAPLPTLRASDLTVEALSLPASTLRCPEDSTYSGSSSWLCVRPAPPRASWPRDAFGFAPAEVARAAAEGMCARDGLPVAHDTEASAARRRQPRPPRLTRSTLGFQVLRIPPALFTVLTALHATGNRSVELHHGKYCQSNHLFDDAPSQWQIVAHGDPADEKGFPTGAGMSEVRDWIAAVQQQIIESWQARERPLQLVHFYGLRDYSEGAMMINHRDDARNRIFGVVMQVAQRGLGDEGWPLYVEDESRGSADEPEYLELFLQPGSMVLYEAARLTHGRPRRLKGESFVNAFIHFKPVPKPRT